MRGRAFRPLLLILFCVALSVLQGCASLAERDKADSYAVRSAPEDALARLVPSDLATDGGSAFRPLPFSGYAMDARLTLARHAQKTLDIQYYLLQNDSTGRAFLRMVRDAALRGVRVRILVDDLYTASNDALLQGIAAYDHVEVRLFNPFPAGRALDATRWGLSLLDLSRLNHRMHNKLFIADGAMAIVGGRNIADEYFFRSGRGNFIDFDLLLMGDAVPELADVFDFYWNSRRVFTLDALEPPRLDVQRRRDDFERLTAGMQAMFTPAKAGERDVLGYAPLSVDMAHPPLKLLRGRIRVMADDPEKVSGRSEKGDDPSTVASQVLEAIAHTHEDLLLTSPYFVPGKEVVERIEKERQLGVAVTLVTNSMAANDEPFVSAAYARYRKQLLTAGVQIYEVSPRILSLDAAFDDMFGAMLGASLGRLHAKMLVLDHQTTFVGSMNLDFRSSRANTELGLLVDSPELAGDVAFLVSELRSVGTYRVRLDATRGVVQWVDSAPKGEQVFEWEPEVGLWTRLEVLLFSSFIREELL